MDLGEPSSSLLEALSEVFEVEFVCVCVCAPDRNRGVCMQTHATLAEGIPPRLRRMEEISCQTPQRDRYDGALAVM